MQRSKTASVVFLGTGTSVGVPALGCDCQVCTSSDPRNNRTRCSIAILTSDGNILVDTPPDMRAQLLREKIKLIHAVVYTHEHADHCRGAARFALRHGTPVYATAGTLAMLPLAARGVDCRTIRSGVKVAVGGFEVEPFAVPHDAREPVGLVVEDLAGRRVGVAADLGTRSRLAWVSSSPHAIWASKAIKYHPPPQMAIKYKPGHCHTSVIAAPSRNPCALDAGSSPA